MRIRDKLKTRQNQFILTGSGLFIIALGLAEGGKELLALGVMLCATALVIRGKIFI